MDRKERLTLVQIALGRVFVEFMRQSSDVVMPTAALLEVSSQIEELWHNEITTLESQLAEAERTIGQLKHRIGEIEDERGATIKELRATLQDCYEAMRARERDNEATDARARSIIAAAHAERDEAIRVAVWAVRECVGNGAANSSIVWGDYELNPRHVDHDGTDADIYRALREAMGE